MINLILPFLANLLPDILRRVLPEKMTDVERAAIESQLTLSILAADWKAIEADYSDRADARQLAAADIAKGNAFTSFLAAIVRPLFGLGSFYLVAHSVIAGTPLDGAIKDLIQIVIQFYFGGRVIEKIIPPIMRAIKK